MSITKESTMSGGQKTQARSDRQTRTIAITKAEAFAMLESAIHHCQRAGLTIGGKNEAGALVLTIPGAAYILTHGGTRAAFELMPAPMASAEAAAT